MAKDQEITGREPAAPPAGDFLGLPLAGVDRRALVDWLTGADPARTPPRVAGYLNAHTVNLALRKEGTLGPALRDFDLVYADGMSVVRAGRRRGLPLPERVSGADFFEPFCRAAAERGRTLALVGGDGDLAARCAEEMRRRVDGLDIVHTSRGYLPPESAERRRVLAELQRARPAITLLGMGSPLQEVFALECRAAGLPTTWCVGALFEYYTPGMRRRAPRWMCRAGLEWAFRLSQEPGRLWRRYLLGNIEFILRDRGVIRSRINR